MSLYASLGRPFTKNSKYLNNELWTVHHFVSLWAFEILKQLTNITLRVVLKLNAALKYYNKEYIVTKLFESVLTLRCSSEEVFSTVLWTATIFFLWGKRQQEIIVCKTYVVKTERLKCSLSQLWFIAKLSLMTLRELRILKLLRF